MALAMFGGASRCPSSQGTVINVGAAEGVYAGGIPHQHLASSEGKDCNAVWAASVPTIQASGFKGGHYPSGSQGAVHHVVESSVAWQASGIPLAGQTVVA